MLYVMCCIKDTTVGAFLRPFVTRNRGEALRIFTDEVNRMDVQNPLSVHPKDFELWTVGTFDDVTGFIECKREEMSVLAVGVDVRLPDAKGQP